MKSKIIYKFPFPSFLFSPICLSKSKSISEKPPNIQKHESFGRILTTTTTMFTRKNVFPSILALLLILQSFSLKKKIPDKHIVINRWGGNGKWLFMIRGDFDSRSNSLAHQSDLLNLFINFCLSLSLSHFTLFLVYVCLLRGNRMTWLHITLCLEGVDKYMFPTKSFDQSKQPNFVCLIIKKFCSINDECIG